MKTTFVLILLLGTLCKAIASPGDVDPRFFPTSGPSMGAEARRLVVMPGGKVVVAGERGSPIRFNFDGSVDPTFQVPIYPYSRVHDMAVAGEKLYLVTWASYEARVWRCGPDGSEDGSFAPLSITSVYPDPVYIYSIASTIDGGCVVSGYFRTTSQGIVTNIARLKADGTLDKTFTTNTWNLNIGAPQIVRQLWNGKFIVSGGVSQGLYARFNSVRRLNENGTIDPTFGASFVHSIGWCNRPPMMTEFVLLPDSRMLVAGSCDIYGTSQEGRPCGAVTRLLDNGSLDLTFRSNTNLLNAASIALQSDGKIVVAGNIWGTPHFTRLLPTGEYDATFTNAVLLPERRWFRYSGDSCFEEPPPTVVYRIAIDPWDDINIAGQFTSINGTPRQFVARLFGGATDSPPRLAANSWTSGKFTYSVAGPLNYSAAIEASGLDFNWTLRTNIIITGTNRLVSEDHSSNLFFRARISRP